MKRTILTLFVAGATLWPFVVTADVGTGKTKFEQACAECHEPADFAATAPADLTKQLRGIVKGTVKHKPKLKLTDAEITGLVAYVAGGKDAAAAVAPAAGAAAASGAGAGAAAGAAPAAGPKPAPAASATAAGTPTGAKPAQPTASAPANTAAGKAAFEKSCADCHEPAEFNGTVASVEARLADVAAGKVKHKKKVVLSAADAKAMAAYLVAGG